MHYVYVLREVSGKLYIGYTRDLRRRFSEHAKTRQKVELLYYEAYTDAANATKREWQLKQYGGAWRALRARIEKRAG